MTDDDYFPKDEDDEEDSTEEDYDEDDDSTDEEESGVDEDELTNINNIIIQRNKIAYERKIRKKDFNDRINRVLLDLFGNPDNPNWIPKVEELEDEVNQPLVRRHPIADKTKAFIQSVKSLHVEYKSAHKYFDKSVFDIGILLDNTIKLHKSEVKRLNDELAKYQQKEEEKDDDVVVTQEMIDIFMKERGYKYIQRYFNALENKDVKVRDSSKACFVQSGTRFFLMHPNPREYSNRLFESIALKIRTEQIKNHKKNEKPSEGVGSTEQNQGSSSSLNNPDDTSNSDSEEEEEESDLFGIKYNGDN